ncbi:MAG: chromosome segregation protein SMC [Planctomycetota bacterium]|jgi:chromosome segregation protein
MKIKKLILQGFKSFADKTEFEFKKGITVIVGPNGCGKSNVVDAVKWVLGEQRPSSLRGKEMQDVIFSGTNQRKGVGCAEVSLVLDNGAGSLPLEYEEVVVTRRLYRSGESEYLLNGNRVRLRDIRELMMDSGGGPGGLSVMEQGNIDRLLRADPKERRLVFEEAAGIAKYRSRRRETERKLERTAENLARLRDILSEQETRQRSLKIQAGKARRWREFTEALKQKRLTGALARYAELAQRRGEAERELGEVQRLEAGARTTLEEAVTSGEGRRKELDARREQVAGGEAEMGALVGERRAAEEKRAAREREASELAERAGQADAARAEAERRGVAQAEELAAAQREQAEAAAEQVQRTEALAAAEALCEEVEGRAALLRRERDDLDLKRTEAFAAETRARNEEVSCDAELRALDQRLRRLVERVESSGVELRSLEADQKQAGLALRRAEEEQRALEDRHVAAEDGAKQARRAADDMTEKAGRLTGEAAALTARRDVLTGLVADGEGLTAGTRALLEAGREGTLEGIQGILADLIGDVGAQAAALDQALGELAEAVVVETTPQGLAAIAWLKEGKRGRARLIPLDRAGTAALPARFAGACRGRMAGLLGALLRGTRVVATIDEALAQEKDGQRVVVLGGEELESSGAIVGGTGDAGAGLVTRNAELAEVEGRLAETEQARGAAERGVREARARTREWESTLEELGPGLRRARAAVRTAGERMAATGKAAATRAEEMDLEQAEHADVERLIGDARQRQERARGDLARAEGERAALEAEADGLRERLGKVSGAREEASARRTEAKVELARWTEKARALEARTHALVEAIHSSRREAEARADEAETCRERRRACRDEIETLSRLGREREKALDRLAAQIEEWRSSVREMRTHLEAGDAHVRELRAAHEERREELERHRLRENEIRLRVETLLEQVRRDHGLDLDRVEPDPEAAAADPAQLEADITELREKIERLGNVNHAALEELALVEEKLAFLRREEADLVAADQQLRETIVRIDEICTNRFTDTFEKVKEHFQVTFRKLFGGGRAEIFLEDPADILWSGIEIRVRPPGKDLRNMALLSGGERSLTTVALLFSIYLTKPPPFCLLDEVDAALDEPNNVRMCEMLKEFARTGQFLVITHARPTMTVADTLYGVTMPEAGVSRHVSVRFADIEAGRIVGLN